MEFFPAPAGQVVLSCGKYFKQLKTQLAITFVVIFLEIDLMKGLDALFAMVR
ncbi:hypothetical protein NLG42_19860 [Flavobacterium plurextorum]|uniref:hypothetical protein n=1 Tax=Flavobacterium TaxID=237 RepID=UPI00214D8E44|nr:MULTISPECIES: hypothetical protein [Flavobacterium]UUW08352.1 hypothetical protein NLG42_19860 [Flavobacterium plurextorum]